MSNDYSSKLIYGKNPLERIVSIEVSDNVATVFRELEDGSLDIQKHPNRFWILASKPFGPGWIKLEGNQHFKYGKQYKDFSSWQSDKKALPYQETYTINNQIEAFQVKDGFTYFKGCRHDEISILSFDIETTGLEHNNDSKVILITNTFRRLGKIQRKLFSCDDYSNCAEMIDDWCKWVQEIDPSIICGHNIYGFDLGYIQFVYNRYKEGGIKLGRLEKPIYFNKWESKFRVDGSRELHYNKCQIYGREIVDTMFLAYKYDLARKYESYGLKKIIAQEGLEKKDRQFYDASKIKDNYTNPEEMKKIKAYAEEDADDALTLYDMMCPPFFYMTQMIPKPYQLVIESATGSQLNSIMVRSYLQDKHSIPKASEAVDFEGAISFGEPGIYANAVSYDIASLYPSIMLQYDVHSVEKDPKRHMPQLLDTLRTGRLKYKKLAKETGDGLYKHLDTSNKVLINSLYGFMGATGLQYNYPEGAAEVTHKGRKTLLFSIEWAKSKGYTVPKGDTDSITLWNNGIEFSSELKHTLLEEINSLLPEHIKFELDDCYDSLLVFKAKNYAYRVGEKITTKGSAVKSSTKSEVMKSFINKGLTMLLYGQTQEDVAQLYESYIYDIMNVKTQDDIRKYAARKTLSSTMVESERKNETRVTDAIKGTDYKEGDRFWVYRMPDQSLKLVEHFDGNYDKKSLLKNLYDTADVFCTVLPKELFKNYSLVKNFKILLDKYPSSNIVS